MNEKKINQINLKLVKGDKKNCGTAVLTERAPSSYLRCSSPEARNLIPYSSALKFNVLPLGIVQSGQGDILHCAVCGRASEDLEKALKFISGCQVKLIEIDDPALKDAIYSAYHGDHNLLQNEIVTLRESGPKNTCSNQESAFLPSSSGLPRVVARVLQFALAQGASDIHIWPEREGAHLRLRVNGELLDYHEPLVTLKQHAEIISRLKVMAALDITCHSLPQDGAFNIPYLDRTIRARLSIMPTLYGEKAVIRLPLRGVKLKLSELSFPQTTLEHIELSLKHPEGAIIFAGPTGGGKTTSMYALLEGLKKNGLNIATIEDPVEIEMAGVAQTELNEKRGLNYAGALKSILRQDPDVILVGEMRDKKSAETTFQAALTGHLLLTTVHARSVFEILLRLDYLGIDPLSLSQTLKLLIVQRLFPSLCDNCKVFDLKGTNRMGFNVYKSVGCEQCGYSGFNGRVPLVESLLFDENVKEAVKKDRELKKDLKLLNPYNYVSFQKSAILLLKAGRLALSQL
ncbi:MAG: type II/IV secretion system protein [Candidatus Dadabacteria bacterium]|nr:MAG: type II/IV secretion system protein [Candidatus Dadabacteria bacterium]